mgnify:CR=1 FL=1
MVGSDLGFRFRKGKKGKYPYKNIITSFFEEFLFARELLFLPLAVFVWYKSFLTLLNLVDFLKHNNKSK